MTSPNLNTFDRSGMTPLRVLRSMAPELRGVVVNLHDALKEMRSSVFRAGSIVLTDEQIARQASLGLDDLARTLPTILQAGFMARDDAGALYSPHLYDKALRSEERAARKAQADQRWELAQASGAEEEGLTRKQITARENGKRGGRPRKGETKEQCEARRAQEAQTVHQQRYLGLLSVVPGGKDKNPNEKPNAVSVSNSVSSVSIDLERENTNTNIQKNTSLSLSTETENPEPKASKAQISQAVARIIAIIGRKDQAGYATSYCKKWLKAGASLELIVCVVLNHFQAMTQNGDEIKKGMCVFDAPVQLAIDSGMTPGDFALREPDPEHVPEPWEKACNAAWAKKTLVFQDAIKTHGTFGATVKVWPEIAAKHGLPDCGLSRAEYEAFFQKNAQVAA